jgi:hypothetical protein
MSVLRMMRVFRVIRLFGRMKELRKMVIACMSSLIPMGNAFLIMIIIASICAPPSSRELRATHRPPPICLHKDPTQPICKFASDAMHARPIEYSVLWITTVRSSCARRNLPPRLPRIHWHDDRRFAFERTAICPAAPQTASRVCPY